MKKEIYGVYIDESCHLENDKQPLICIGYTKIKKREYTVLKEKLKQLKLKHKTPTELKWNKLSYSRLDYYKALVDFFFNNAIEFRAILAKNKNQLDHQKYNKGDHNAFYYKLVYLLLKNPYVNNGKFNYHVYLDIKDTRGRERLPILNQRLQKGLSGKSPFTFFQHIRSDENEFLQLSDFFIGAITYKAKGEHLKPNAAKVKKEVVAYIEHKSGYCLDDGTDPFESKFNIFDFQIQKTK